MIISIAAQVSYFSIFNGKMLVWNAGLGALSSPSGGCSDEPSCKYHLERGLSLVIDLRSLVVLGCHKLILHSLLQNWH
jgi:hypothetical protein